MCLKSKEENFNYICIIERQNGEVHYNGTRKFVKNFQNNEKILDYSDSMLESRRDSILEKLNVKTAKKVAVEPSPFKDKEAPHQMTFLPNLMSAKICRNIGQAQKLELSGMVPQSDQSIAIDPEHLVTLRQKTFTRQRRRNPKARLQTSDETESKKKGRVAKKGQKKKK